MYLVLLFCFSTLFSCTICQNDDDINLYTLIENGISDADKQIILDQHNTFRAEIAFGKDEQPLAKNMRKMKWNDDLAELAQYWANTGRITHDPDLGQLKLGQNIARSDIQGKIINNPSFAEACKRWYDERFLYTYAPVTEELANAQPPVYHYVQVVSAHSYEIGCGYAVFQGPQPGIGRKSYVCNYGPLGNIVDMYPYQRRAINEPFCGQKLVNSDIDGLCDPAPGSNPIVPRYKLQRTESQLKPQNITQKNSLTFDVDFSFFNSLAPIVKGLTPKKNRAAKLEIVKLLYALQFGTWLENVKNTT